MTSHRLLQTSAVVLFTTLACGCVWGASDAEPSARQPDRVLVPARGSDSQSGPAAAEDQAQTAQWSVEEILRIGSINERESALTSVGPILVDSAGDVYVAQPLDNQILVFGSGGRRLRTIGGVGEGPGEFQRLFQIGFLADTLYAVDLALRRVTFFALHGQVIGTLQVAADVAPPMSPTPPFRLFPDGAGWAVPGVFVVGPTLGTVTRVPTLRIDRSGTVLDTVGWSAFEEASMMIDTPGGGRLSPPQPFRWGPLIVPSGDGHQVAEVTRRPSEGVGDPVFRVTVTGLGQDTVYSRSYTYAPIELPREVVDSVAAGLAARIEGYFPSPAAAEAAIHGAMYVPSHRLPVSDARYSETGELWLRREAVSGRPQHWMVLNELGDVVADALIPAGAEVRLIRETEIWAVIHDQYDVPYVVQYRLVK